MTKIYKIPRRAKVTREYREVERIGMRGDLVVLDGGKAFITLTEEHLDCGFADENKIGGYHVLEPTGVVYIDGKRYTVDEPLEEFVEDSDESDIDALYDVTTRLTVKVASLERKLTERACCLCRR